MTSMLREGLLHGATQVTGLGDWNQDWDAAVLKGALLQLDKSFDPEEELILGHVGPEYSYQSNLRSQKVHPTRTSMEYALYLMESRDTRRMETALKNLDRMEELQEKDPISKWFGLWGWYAEEPPVKMPAVDFNWADFNGALLLCMIFRYRGLLSPSTRADMPHAQPLLHLDSEAQCGHGIHEYRMHGYICYPRRRGGTRGCRSSHIRSHRLHRFATYIDRTGTFEEYNSPTYTRVVIQNMTRMLMFVKEQKALELARRIHERAWLHVATHWHLPTRQIRRR